MSLRNHTAVRPLSKVAPRAVVSPRTLRTKPGSRSNKENVGVTRVEDHQRLKNNEGQEASTSSVLLDTAADMTNKTWTVYRATPLFNFSTDDTALASYGKALSSRFRSEASKHILGAAHSDTMDTPSTEIRDVNFMEMKSVQDDLGRMILTVVVPNQSGDKAEFQALLCAGDDNEEVDEDFESLPLVLTKGSRTFIDVFLDFMTKTFDAQITQHPFEPQQMRKFGLLWAPRGDVKSRPFGLTYLVPSPEKGLAKISIKVDVATMEEIWDQVHSDEAEDMSLIDLVERHFSNVFKIHLRGMRLESVGSSTCFVGGEGKLKILTKQPLHIAEILTQLCELVRL